MTIINRIVAVICSVLPCRRGPYPDSERNEDEVTARTKLGQSNIAVFEIANRVRQQLGSGVLAEFAERISGRR